MINKTNKSFAMLLIVLFMMFLIGCAGVNPALYVPVDQAVSINDFDDAISEITLAQSGKKPIYNERNVISMYLDKGLLEHYAGKWQASAQSLGRAEQAIAEAFTKSISANVASYIVNDNTREYPGEDFEDIYISVFNALNYYRQGSLDGALVEIRKLTLPSGKIEMLERKYAEANEKAKRENQDKIAAAQNDPNASKIPEMQRVSFTNSALARYLSVLFYQADGNEDAARIEMDLLRYAFSSQPNIYTHSMPRAISNIESLSNPDGKARVDIVSFIGISLTIPQIERRPLLNRFL